MTNNADTTDTPAVFVKFEYTGPEGQKVGFGLVVPGAIYEVPATTAAILEADADFKKLKGKAAEEASAVGGWPEGPIEPAVPSAEPIVEEAPEDKAPLADLDRAIISYTTPAPRGGRRAAKATK